MEKINVELEYKQEVIDIWHENQGLKFFLEDKHKYRRSPILPATVEKNCLMFIGLNPSFPKRTTIPEHEREIGFYKISKNKNVDISYFEKMKEFADYCNTNWTHLDLFFIRETSQALVEALSHSDIDFLNRQLDISFDIIKRSKPKLIIVSNALASEFFGKMKLKHKGFEKIWRGFDLFFEGENSTFNPEIGTYEIELNDEKVPIIFSGMLSGQRALDIGSLERLKWQSKMILEHLNNV